MASARNQVQTCTCCASRAGKDVLMNQESCYVVGYDFSDVANLALYRAFEEAAHETHAKVEVVWVTTPSAAFMMGFGVDAIDIAMRPASMQRRALWQATHDAYREWSRNHEAHISLTTHVKVGAPAEELISFATEHDAKLLIMGTHHRSFLRRLLHGSVAERVVRSGQLEVLVVQPRSGSHGAAGLS
jgi:nucleotide-binding universal stress UspA family protein